MAARYRVNLIITGQERQHIVSGPLPLKMARDLAMQHARENNARLQHWGMSMKTWIEVAR